MPAHTAEASLSFPAELSQMARLRQFVEDTALGWQADPDELADVILAVDELATNSTLHGYRGRSGTIEIVVRRAGADLILILRDQAPTFDPNTVPPPDVSLPLEQRPIGGVGLHLVRHMVDELRHRARPKGGNELTLTKHNVFL
jgi:serine/threonine-protein kinase RsbW